MYNTLHFFYLISERERIFQYTPPSDNTPLQAKRARKATFGIQNTWTICQATQVLPQKLPAVH